MIKYAEDGMYIEREVSQPSENVNIIVEACKMLECGVEEKVDKFCNDVQESMDKFDKLLSRKAETGAMFVFPNDLEKEYEAFRQCMAK